MIDIWTPFTSADFRKFCEEQRIKHMRSPVCHTQSNGLAECFLDTPYSVLSKLGEKRSVAGNFSTNIPGVRLIKRWKGRNRQRKCYSGDVWKRLFDSYSQLVKIIKDPWNIWMNGGPVQMTSLGGEGKFSKQEIWCVTRTLAGKEVSGGPDKVLERVRKVIFRKQSGRKTLSSMEISWEGIMQKKGVQDKSMLQMLNTFNLGDIHDHVDNSGGRQSGVQNSRVNGIAIAMAQHPSSVITAVPWGVTVRYSRS